MPFREPLPDPHKRVPGSESDADLEPDADEGWDEGAARDEAEGMEGAESRDAGAQPEDENRVDEDMATIALDRPLDTSSGTRAGFDAGRSVTPSQLSAMSDAEIMLRVREGDDSGFEYLI